MKKDGIQTRNRKLATKSKKKRGSVVDFFAPFEKSFAYGTMPGMAPSSSGSPSSYLTNPMSQYYTGMAGQMTSQFMADFAGASSAPSLTSSGLSGMYGADVTTNSEEMLAKDSNNLAPNSDPPPSSQAEHSPHHHSSTSPSMPSFSSSLIASPGVGAVPAMT